MKRAGAEKEARARGGLTMDRVNGRLDYLVIGSIPNPQWRFGKYGNKIADARRLREEENGPEVVSEDDYLTALAETPPTNSGEVDEKIVVVTYKFTGDPETDDWPMVESCLRHLHDDLGCHVSLSSYPVLAASEVFGENLIEESGMRVHCRIVRVMGIKDPVEKLVTEVNRTFSAVQWLRDTKTQWFERQEGTAGFIRLIESIPSCITIPME